MHNERVPSSDSDYTLQGDPPSLRSSDHHLYPHQHSTTWCIPFRSLCKNIATDERSPAITPLAVDWVTNPIPAVTAKRKEDDAIALTLFTPIKVFSYQSFQLHSE